ncbi:hypothetical protein HYALB_00006870 [Hymenoscyphus albidus]|uniref:Major facilitator superfamily (MFS) profile domain-containing protein n=1 Tax=Hymenoscyphus albidus TaxID=595503 RepID=A0A9N9PRS2_9HELO|nr:hypothetical protein HYALB_00006870 [Hymenoscyphus albidus]
MASSSSTDKHAPTENTPLIQPQNDYQSHILPRKRLLIVFPALALVHFTSFLDQTAITTSIPAIAAGLKTGPSTSWIGASFLMTSVSIQLINGRFSDIFGRKPCLITALLVMGLGNLLSGFARTPAVLYITRAFSGFGAGALNGLIQITISDITALEHRGYYFGIMGIAVAFGNGLGPVVGGALTQNTSWRWAFWFICPLTALAVAYLWLVLPQSESPENVLKKIRSVDWLGVVTNMTAICLILIPLSRGGTPDVWKSKTNIIMLVAGCLLFCVFIFLEFRVVKFPIVPKRLFTYGRSTNILLAMNLFIGWLFWGNLFFIPLYLQSVRGWSPTMAGLFILPLVIAHGITSGLSGIIISRLGHYVSVISVGTALWALGAGAKVTYHRTTPIWQILTFGVFEGVGVGVCLQPVLVGILAGSDKIDRAGITSVRNFLRDIGAATGITVSGAILNTILQNGLQHRFTPEFISEITSSIGKLSQLHLTPEDRELISRVYMEGIHGVFMSFAVLAVVLFVVTFLIEDYGLRSRDEVLEEVE